MRYHQRMKGKIQAATLIFGLIFPLSLWAGSQTSVQGSSEVIEENSSTLPSVLPEDHPDSFFHPSRDPNMSDDENDVSEATGSSPVSSMFEPISVLKGQVDMLIQKESGPLRLPTSTLSK
ncbi:MAG: hypothetical protein IPK68_17475 [Bdellovibrionales bacterium]|nr:hypothetical protein [Bdellovibrionales bacterium]